MDFNRPIGNGKADDCYYGFDNMNNMPDRKNYPESIFNGYMNNMPDRRNYPEPAFNGHMNNMPDRRNYPEPAFNGHMNNGYDHYFNKNGSYDGHNPHGVNHPGYGPNNATNTCDTVSPYNTQNGYHAENDEVFEYSTPNHRADSTDSAAKDSHLSFLYDKAQGCDYTTATKHDIGGHSSNNAYNPAVQPQCNGNGYKVGRPQDGRKVTVIGHNKSPVGQSYSNSHKPQLSADAPPPLPPSTTHPAHQGYMGNSLNTFNSTEDEGRPVRVIPVRSDPSTSSDNRISNSQQCPAGDTSRENNSGSDSKIDNSTNLQTDSIQSSKQQTSTPEELKKRTVNELASKLSTTSLSSKVDNMSNYDNWKKIVNERKMSLPGYVDRSRMEKFQRKVSDIGSDSLSTDRTAHSLRTRSGSVASNSELDSTSIRHQLREGDDPLENYDESSIRYKGRMNPSKTFRLVQSVTSSDNESEVIQEHLRSKKPPTRRRVKPASDGKSDINADDIVDISYIGGSIPSKTFRQLRQAMGEPESGEPDQPPFSAYANNQCTVQPSRSVKVIHLRRFSAGNVLEM